MDPLLSICIATLNRARYIGATLATILPQAGSDVEVVILDGGSRDGTAEIVRSFQQRFPGLRYIRKEAAGGIDRDYDECVVQARGRYAWLMSDDDLLKPGAVAEVALRCREGHALVVVNSDVRDVGLARILTSRILPWTRDRAYSAERFEAVFLDTARYLTFVGGIVLRRDLWLARERERYYGTAFGHVGVLFQAPLPGTVYGIARPLITIRYGNAHWTPRGFEIWAVHWPAVVWSFPISDAAKRRVTAREPWREVRRLLGYRGTGAFSAAEYERFVEPRLRGSGLRCAYRLLARMPGVLANALGMLYLTFLAPSMPFAREARIDLMNSRFYLGGRRR